MIRDSLIKTVESDSSPQSPLMWETTFARIARALNDLPIAKGNPTGFNLVGFELITLNRLLLGRNNSRGLVREGVYLNMSAILQKMMARSHEIFGCMVPNLY